MLLAIAVGWGLRALFQDHVTTALRPAGDAADHLSASVD